MSFNVCITEYLLVRFYKNSVLLKEVVTFSTQGMKRTNKKFQKSQEHDQTEINLFLPTELLVEHVDVNLCPPDKLIVEQMDINLCLPEKLLLDQMDINLSSR